MKRVLTTVFYRRLTAALILFICISILPIARTEGVKSALEQKNLTLAQSYKNLGESNPLYTQRFGADPGVMEYNGRLYVYMTDDRIEYSSTGQVKENSYSMIRHINCISSDDLVNWTDHGRIPVAGPGGIAASWAKNSWAPCAAHKEIDGKEKFFLYFCNGGNGIGVLTADSPTGPWQDALGHLLITRQTPGCADVVWLFDPAVMVDEDGTGYLAFGGGVPEGMEAAPGTGRIVRLGEDMMSLDGDPVMLDAPYLFEDSGLNRMGDKYIYSYCSNWQTDGNAYGLTNGAIQYMESDHPLGPYSYVGEVFPNEGKFFGMWGNNHHSIVSLDGEHYLFYHNRPVEKAMGITGNYRSPQADRLSVSPDGTLKVVGTMRGLSQRKPFDPYREIPAATMANQADISLRQKNEDRWIHTLPGSWTMIAGVDFQSGSGNMRLTLSAPSGGMVWVVTDAPDGTVAAECTLPEGTNEPSSFTVPLSLQGVHDLFFVFSDEMDFYSWQAGR